jgi:hypothetical protein
MRDPAFAVGPLPWLDALYPATQLATAATLAWEWCAPLILVSYWQRGLPAPRPGPLRRLLAHRWFLPGWIAVGAGFHLGTALTLRLGIFPFACLALYPAFVRPERLRALLRRARA